MTLGNRLRALREKRKLTQKELAEKLNIPNQNISNYERDFRQPDYETLQMLADFFGVTTDYLLGRSGKLPQLTKKDEKDIAKKMESILEEMDSDTALAFDGEPMDEETKELVRAAIESNLRLAKQIAKKKFTPKKYKDENKHQG